jgi:hypothetical protein
VTGGSPLTPQTLRREIDRPLSPAEARAWLEAPVSDREREEVLALVRWFRRRYPTGADRLAYVRRAYRRWSARLVEPTRGA